MIIDPKSHVPIYRQIVEQVRSAIDAGVYRPGEALPSLRALAVEIRVNPNTVQRAYEELDRQGVIESRRGLGVFVVERDRQPMRDKHQQQLTAALSKAVTAALDQGIAPARIRELFESVLSGHLERARKRR